MADSRDILLNSQMKVKGELKCLYIFLLMAGKFKGK